MKNIKNLTLCLLLYDYRTCVLDIQQDLPMSCLTTVGDKYILTAKMKLLNSEGNPFACDKNAAWGTALTCPQVTITVDHPTEGVKRFHYANLESDAWEEDEWNDFRAIVTVNTIMSGGDSAFFYVQGPAPEVSIVFDDVELTLDS